MNRPLSTATFLLSVLASIGLLFAQTHGHSLHWLWVTLGVSVLVTLGARAASPLFETTLLPTIWLVAAHWVPMSGIRYYAPFIGWMLVSLAQLSGSRVLIAVAALSTIPWMIVGDANAANDFQFAGLVCTGLSLVAVACHSFTSQKPLSTVDIILCSYSANTAHFTQQFVAGVEQAGTKAVLHRHHRTPEESLVLSGEGLVVAYPVIGWNPPYPVFDMLWDLPRGGGKPAFILYTSAGGPENAFFLGWLVLLIKGYRPTGRLGGTYPANITTARLGPQRFWNWLDKLLPRSSDLRLATECGKGFALGEVSGLPFWLWPSPLFLLNFPTIFKLVNRYIYRPYLWKWRCTKCGACVRACPTNRFREDADGYPISCGRCVMCYNCVNLCPTNAMQAVALTEYGARYRPRFPKLLAKIGRGGNNDKNVNVQPQPSGLAGKQS